MLLVRVLTHLARPAAALQEAWRVLRPGGLLVGGCPRPGSPERHLGSRRPTHHATSGLCGGSASAVLSFPH
ncbi:methyltransferase domain-containing protein [uncultured Deinococcus sp.]|uniref:methyltransferase domain-containing protein n=1 Tax=uncultured Deinococcus sp. TaxID=158789 RepID=UPI0025883F8E|nr:methyltransferase domain-containing protein [uncultured Deinococcus sp.]